MVINRNGTRCQYALTGLGMVGLLAMPIDAATLPSDRLPTQPNHPFLQKPSLLTPHPSRLPSLLTRKFSCPAVLEPLTAALLRDLPGYINRSNFRLASRPKTNPTYAIVASQPDFVPLPADSSEYPSPKDANLHQVFFTVLERQYAGKQVVEFQQFHWLFLTQTADGWQLALLFSRIGSYPSDRQPVTPPRDSSQSATAEAIRNWLRSCEAGAVKS
ncbi:hypothetical protein [Stenomitos frigidus]|uniref:hypothetical protein n=1 Tax=Stenomitos frigidus TaxID=1886765 RepID=UPI0015E679F7|nr:hypothetical protein [Stenomitos frigidus]